VKKNSPKKVYFLLISIISALVAIVFLQSFSQTRFIEKTSVNEVIENENQVIDDSSVLNSNPENEVEITSTPEGSNDYLQILNSSQSGEWNEVDSIQDIGQTRLLSNDDACLFWEFENGFQVERAAEPMQIYQGVVLVGNDWILNDYSRELNCATGVSNILGGIKIN
jgi:hypothetical protein